MKALFVVGSRPTLTGTVYDNINGVRTAKDLSGATVVIKAMINGGAAKSWAATIDPDQVNNKGRFTYPMEASDIDVVGTVEIQAVVTIGGKPVISDMVVKNAQRAIP